MKRKYVYGIDLGGTTCKFGLVLSDGKMREKCEIPSNTRDSVVFKTGENRSIKKAVFHACKSCNTLAVSLGDNTDNYGGMKVVPESKNTSETRCCD